MEPDNRPDCTTCNGTGWDSAARRAGMEDAPVYFRPIGVWQCTSCNGTGKIGLTDEMARVLSEAIRESIDADVLQKLKDETSKSNP